LGRRIVRIVHVFVSVVPEAVEGLPPGDLENARNSLLEPGVARFDFLE
jgi:hypothetical protein